jgi:hypothetical protein
MLPRHLVPRPSVQQPPPSRVGPPAVLLVEEGHASGLAVVAEVAEPVGVAAAMAGAALPAGDQPPEVVQLQGGQRTQQGLGADEAGGGGDGAQAGVGAPGTRADVT